MNRKHDLLILLAAAGLVLAVILLITGSARRTQMLADDGQTRPAVEASVASILPAQTTTAADPSLLAAAARLAEAPYVAWVWVVNPQGEILFREGGPGQVGENVAEIARLGDGLNLVNALPAEQLDAEDRLAVLAVAAMRTEGEHNDVFRPLLAAIPGEDGRTAALVVLAYDVNAGVSGPPLAEIVSVLFLLLGLALYWLSLPLWVILDARGRGEPAALWGLFLLFANLAGLLAYLIVISRPVPKPG